MVCLMSFLSIVCSHLKALADQGELPSSPRPQTSDQRPSHGTQRKRGFFSRVFGNGGFREPSQGSSSSGISLRGSSSMGNLFRPNTNTEINPERRAASRGQSASNDLPLLNPSPPREVDAERLVSAMHEDDAVQRDGYRLETPLISQGRFSWGEPFVDNKPYSPVLLAEASFSETRSHTAETEGDVRAQADESPKAAQGAAAFGSQQNSVGLRTSSLENLEADYATKAQALYDCSDPSPPMEYANFLGTDLPFNAGVRKAFMGLFDFSGLSIIKALRLLCSKLFIRGETQVLDRIIEAFAERWHDCNKEQEGRWLSQDMAYILAFAMIALNTDLHIANHDGIERKMKRSEFVNNTITAIRAGASRNISRREPPRRASSVRNSTDRSEVPLIHSTIRVVRSVSQAQLDQENEQERQDTARRAAEIDAWRDPPKSDLSREMYIKEILLDAYTSIAREQIRQPLLPLGSGDVVAPVSRVASSDTIASTSGLAHMIRSASSTSQISQLYRRASTSRDMRQSRQSNLQLAPPTCSIGFVGTINSVIREESQQPGETPVEADNGIPDALALHGAPFAKEGRLLHSLLQPQTTFATLTKRSSTSPVKIKGWSSELFGVLEKGHLCLFDLTKKVTSVPSNETLGGGDWTRGAKIVLQEPLNHAVAFGLSTKAYKDHPHVWSLITASGQRHAFATGSQELVDEWVLTANYWAGRVSKEPLLGAVGSAEYGWGEQLTESAAQQDEAPDAVPRTATSTRSKRTAPGDQLIIQEWRPEPHSTMTSTLPVVEQLAVLSRVLVATQEEHKQHQAKQARALDLFSPRSDNYRRVKANFELRDQALRKDIVKYDAYTAALRQGLHAEDRLRQRRSVSSQKSTKAASVPGSR